LWIHVGRVAGFNQPAKSPSRPKATAGMIAAMSGTEFMAYIVACILAEVACHHFAGTNTRRQNFPDRKRAPKDCERLSAPMLTMLLHVLQPPLHDASDPQGARQLAGGALPVQRPFWARQHTEHLLRSVEELSDLDIRHGFILLSLLIPSWRRSIEPHRRKSVAPSWVACLSQAAISFRSLHLKCCTPIAKKKPTHAWRDTYPLLK
jgi:hypothetical protein